MKYPATYKLNDLVSIDVYAKHEQKLLDSSLRKIIGSIVHELNIQHNNSLKTTLIHAIMINLLHQLGVFNQPKEILIKYISDVYDAANSKNLEEI